MQVEPRFGFPIWHRHVPGSPRAAATSGRKWRGLWRVYARLCSTVKPQAIRSTSCRAAIRPCSWRSGTFFSTRTHLVQKCNLDHGGHHCMVSQARNFGSRHPLVLYETFQTSAIFSALLPAQTGLSQTLQVFYQDPFEWYLVKLKSFEFRLIRYIKDMVLSLGACSTAMRRRSPSRFSFLK